jgi:hypothetical protein
MLTELIPTLQLAIGPVINLSLRALWLELPATRSDHA